MACISLGGSPAKSRNQRKLSPTTFLEGEVLFELATHVGADVIVQKPHLEEMWVGTVRQLLPGRMDNAQLGT